MSQGNGKVKRVYLGMPNYGTISHETWGSVLDAVRTPGFEVYARRSEWSLLAHNFNELLVECLNDGKYDYWALIHADISADAGWLATVIGEMDARGFDVIHVPASIKNHECFTSTALAYSDDNWQVVRRITQKELATLPETFDIHDIREHFDAEAKHLLPNTGCMILKIGDWVEDFTGFEIKDRIRNVGGVWTADVVPEDWNFGLWCGANNLRVGATRKVVVGHKGTFVWKNNITQGLDTDLHWQKHKELAECPQ